MTIPAGDDISLGELVAPVVRFWRRIVLAGAAVTALAAVAGTIYYLRQPTLRTVAVSFRPTFDEAIIEKYPGGQRFLLADVLQPSLIDRSVRRLGAEHYCAADEVSANLRGRFVGAVHSPSNEVRVVRPIFELVFEPRGRCAALPDDVAIKLLSGILSEWATDAVERRGVLQSRKARITPDIFTRPIEGPLFVRSERAREAIERVLGQIEQFKQQPGSELVRLSDLTLEVLEFRLQGLLAPLDRLTVLSAVAASAPERQWLTDALSAAEIAQREAQQDADSQRLALHEYSSMTPAEATLKNPAILDNRESFKQELTTAFVRASERANQKARAVDRYQWLRATVATQPATALSPAVLQARLDELVRAAGQITADFNRLYDVFVQTRTGEQGLLYRIERGPEVTVNKAFALRDLLLLLIGVAFGSLVLLAGGVLMRSHWRWLLQGEPAKSSAAE